MGGQNGVAWVIVVRVVERKREASPMEVMRVLLEKMSGLSEVEGIV